MSLSDCLQQLMQLHGNISATELARVTGVPQPTIHHMLTGFTKRPRKQALEALAGFFSITVEQLTGEKALPPIIPDVIKEHLHFGVVPLIEWDMLSNWPTDNAYRTGMKEILLDRKITPNSFALIARDESLQSLHPAIPQHALMIFDAGKTPKNRDIVVASLGKDRNILITTLFQDNNQNYLKQNEADGNVRLIRIDPDCGRILGTLVEVRIAYES